jgi:hypothetical protein
MASLLEKAFDFIAPHENTIKSNYLAQWDVSRYSIGFGTRSYLGELITYDIAVQRSKEYIENEIDEISHWPYWTLLSDSQKVSVLDYAYQWGVPNFKASGFAQRIKNKLPVTLEWAKSDPNFFKWCAESRAMDRLKKYNELEQTIENISFYGGVSLIILFAIIYKFIS